MGMAAEVKADYCRSNEQLASERNEESNV